jgi:hypothetical protein
MRITVVDRNKTTRRGFTLIVVAVTALVIAAFSLFLYSTPANAGAPRATTLCGDGSAPDYGFTYALQQTYWVVNWQNFASQQAVVKADAILNQLNQDSIAQTMVLFQSQDQVGNRVNCAVHFLRYMQLGLPTGERKDNGFVFLVVVEPTAIDVHYGVGLGLPALTAPELTDINRAAEATYQSTHNMDQALLTLAQEFDKVARSNYAPLTASISSTTVAETNNTPQTPAGPLDIFTICGQLCLGIIVLLFLLWMFTQMARRGISFGSGGGGFGGGGWGGGGGRGWGGGGGGGGGRGGSGSGRSGRGN